MKLLTPKPSRWSEIRLILYPTPHSLLDCLVFGPFNPALPQIAPSIVVALGIWLRQHPKLKIKGLAPDT